MLVNECSWGDPLRDLARVVSSWRKLELESWPGLLRTREVGYAHRARTHWVRIHLVLRNFLDSASDETAEKLTPYFVSPRWLWKGLARDAEKLTGFSQESSKNLPEVVKSLDTFCLSSPLGEFETRLSILQAFRKSSRRRSPSLRLERQKD